MKKARRGRRREVVLIHSLSGGVIADNGMHSFVKVDVSGTPYWYLAPRRLAPGQRVLVPCGKTGRPAEGTVLRCENCTPQTAPVPMNRVREVLRVIGCAADAESLAKSPENP